MTEIAISIGSNTEPRTHIPAGLSRLGQIFQRMIVSPIYETPPYGEGFTVPYCNAVARAITDLPLSAIKPHLVAIEDASGRVRRDANGEKSKFVTLDLDLIWYGDSAVSYVYGDKTYQLPDKDILTRDFVAIPLAYLAPEWIHPVTKQTIQQIAKSFAPLKIMSL